MYIKNEILVERHPTKYFIKKNPSNRQVNMFFINSGALRIKPRWAPLLVNGLSIASESNRGGHPYWSMDLALHPEPSPIMYINNPLCHAYGITVLFFHVVYWRMSDASWFVWPLPLEIYRDLHSLIEPCLFPSVSDGT
jgi:hypothetical protein